MKILMMACLKTEIWTRVPRIGSRTLPTWPRCSIKTLYQLIKICINEWAIAEQVCTKRRVRADYFRLVFRKSSSLHSKVRLACDFLRFYSTPQDELGKNLKTSRYIFLSHPSFTINWAFIATNYVVQKCREITRESIRWELLCEDK
jgi:hypothetical protein